MSGDRRMADLNKVENVARAICRRDDSNVCRKDGGRCAHDAACIWWSGHIESAQAAIAVIERKYA